MARRVLVCCVLAVALMVMSADAASLTRVANFGNNPGGLNMYIYVPNQRQSKAAILVAVHYCTGSAQALFNSAGDFISAANQRGFLMVFPEAPRNGHCFDVSSDATLKHNGGGDSQSIAQMVKFAVANYSGDASRVFVFGQSSGAMMTNVLAGAYPDVFRAGVAFMGVPFHCFSTGGAPPGSGQAGWNSQCANGQLSQSGAAWGALVRAAYPGYTGAYPRMQLWHGTADSTLNFNNFGEEIKQWTNVANVSATPVLTDAPQSGWTRTRYGSSGATTAAVEGIRVQGVGHALPQNGMAAYALAFFGPALNSP